MLLFESCNTSVDILQDLNAEAAAENPAKANQAVKNTRENPKASLVDKAIANALDLQQHGRNKEAIKKWLGLARVAKGSDNDLAARAWFSVGYLLHQDNDFKNSIVAYDTAIHLKPDFAEAFNNRGNAKADSGQYAAAITDFDEAIHLKPDYAGAYINRGIAKVKLNLKDEARKDFEIALELAENAGDTSLQTKAEKWLRDLDAAEGS